MTVKVGHGFLKGFRQEVSTAVEHFKNEGDDAFSQYF